MAKPVQWLARMLGLDGSSEEDDDVSSFEYVDGSRLSADEFHQSDAMRLDEALARDFTETLPTFSPRASLPPHARRLAALPGHGTP